MYLCSLNLRKVVLVCGLEGGTWQLLEFFIAVVWCAYDPILVETCRDYGKHINPGVVEFSLNWIDGLGISRGTTLGISTGIPGDLDLIIGFAHYDAQLMAYPDLVASKFFIFLIHIEHS